MVLLTEKYNFRAASCCKVEVVNGGAGDFFAGLVVRSATLKFAPRFSERNCSASALVSKFFGSFALKVFPSSLVNSASILKEASGFKTLNFPLALHNQSHRNRLHPPGRKSAFYFSPKYRRQAHNPPTCPSTRRACWAFTRL